MIEHYKEVYKGGVAEVVEKKSLFLANVFPVKSEEEAIMQIEAIKKKHWDASHNCYAYVIGENQPIQRFSDYGEPSQTAGKPMLDVLLLEGLHNTLVIVTRYFGGTLLGTGGLVRAYSKAAKEGIQNSTIANMHYCVKLVIDTDYNGVGKIQYLLLQKKIVILSSDYTQRVKLTALVVSGEVEELKKSIIEATNGKAEMEESEYLYYAKIEEEVVCFPL